MKKNRWHPYPTFFINIEYFSKIKSQTHKSRIYVPPCIYVFDGSCEILAIMKQIYIVLVSSHFWFDVWAFIILPLKVYVTLKVVVFKKWVQATILEICIVDVKISPYFCHLFKKDFYKLSFIFGTETKWLNFRMKWHRPSFNFGLAMLQLDIYESDLWCYYLSHIFLRY